MISPRASEGGLASVLRSTRYQQAGTPLHPSWYSTQWEDTDASSVLEFRRQQRVKVEAQVDELGKCVYNTSIRLSCYDSSLSQFGHVTS